MSEKTIDIQGNKKQMHLLCLHISEADSLLQNDKLLSDIPQSMSETDTLWVFLYDDTGKLDVSLTPMSIAEKIREGTGLILKNIITRYSEGDSTGGLDTRYEEILFFVKDKREYIFDKDSIRVEHVYKGNEWGNRKKGQSAYHDTEVRRYNPDGKDPGNVWLEEVRNQTSGETVDEILPVSRSEAVKRCVRVGSNEGETIHIYSSSNVPTNLKKSISEEERRVNVLNYE